MISVTKIFEFEAAHYLPSHPGKCKEIHGHSYKLEIEISSGDGDYLNGNYMVIDFGELKVMVEFMLDQYYDHKFLNKTLLCTPTAENMVLVIALYFKNILMSPLKLVRVRLWETSSCYAEWRESSC